MTAAAPAAPSAEDVGRARLYLFLARLLGQPPDAALLETLRGIDGGGSALAKEFDRLAAAARQADVPQAKDDYDRLFIGVGHGELLPYASYYRTGHLNERPLALVRQDLARLGLAGMADEADPEDHVAALFEVMAMLIGGETPEPVGTEMERQFFERHIGRWAHLFFDELQAAGGDGIYGAAGGLGRAFVAIEAEAVALER